MSILLHFFRHESSHFIHQAIHKMTHRDEARLHQWATRITNNHHINPAKALLQALIFADAPRILAELADPTLTILGDIFHDISISTGGGFRQTWDNDTYADWIDDSNHIYHTDTGEMRPISTTLLHLANYLRGNLHAIKPLLYAIINRIWRHVHTRGYYTRLAQVTFLLHTYLFHFRGWSPNPHDITVGVVRDAYDHLAGRTPDDTTDREWDEFAATPHYGLPDFSVIPRVSQELWTAKGAHLAQLVPFQFGTGIRSCELLLADFCDDGVALMAQFDGRNYAYFLSWPRDYEDPLRALFNAHAISAAATQSLKEEEELDDDWDTFHSI